MSREGLRSSKGHNKVCKLLEECEEVTKKTKEFKRKTLKPTEENSDDKGEQVKRRIRIPDHKFQKVNYFLKILIFVYIYSGGERTTEKEN